MITKKTYVAKPTEVQAGQTWYVVDAEGETLGRLASKVARVIMGKHKPMYTPNLDCGDYVVVVNASKVRVTGNRLDEKMYYRHSMHTGSAIKAVPLRTVLERKPERAIRQAVWGMIPHGALGRRMITKLKVYGGGEHPHAAQNPQKLEL
jgi:large subunit ribosomal protein L13